jgi:hypothetical protein
MAAKFEILSRNLLEGVSKIKMHLSRYERNPNQDWNRASPEYKLEALPL